MSYPTEFATTCYTCGAKPGKYCYGNGPMPPGSHSGRQIKAYREEIDRLRAQVEELANEIVEGKSK